MARPSEYNFTLCLDILEEIANGNNIIDVLDNNDKYPSWSTFRRWKRDNEELQTLYVNAQQDKTESLINNIQKVQRMCLKGEIDPATANTVMQTDKWLASKYYPKMFGDNKNVDVTSGNKPLNTSMKVEIVNPIDEDD